jgi:hypothetical protein
MLSSKVTQGPLRSADSFIGQIPIEFTITTRQR